MLSGAALVLVQPVLAQQVAWERRIEVDIPAGIGLKTITPSARDQVGTLSIAVVTYVTFVDRYQYRVVATDPSNGRLRWSHDFGSECSYDSVSQASVVVLAGGDVAVAVHGQARTTNLRHVCVVRLRALDGGLVWSHAEQAVNGHAGIHAMRARANGQLLLAGRNGATARIQAWDAASGATLWQRDITESGSALQAVEIADGPGDLGALHVQVTTGSSVSSRLVGLDLDDGSALWSRAGCGVGASFGVDGQQWQARLRVFDDGTLMQVLTCNPASGSTTFVSRHVAASGALLWQRDLQQSSAAAIIRDDRDVLLAGALFLDGANAGLARLSGTDGSTRWASSRGGDRYRMAQASGRVFILEIDSDVSGYVTALHVASHDVASGVQLAHPQVEGLPALMLADRMHLGAFADGDVVVAGMSGDNRSAGSRLSATRFLPGEAAVRWLTAIPVMQAHPFMAQRPWSTGAQLATTMKGTPGVAVSGDGLKDTGDVYPRAVKLDSRNGRVLWSWQPDGRRNGSVCSLLATTGGDIIIAGDDGGETHRLLLERLDGATGAVGWKYEATASGPALDAALLPDGAAAVVIDGIGTRLVRHSPIDGTRTWDVAIPEGDSAAGGDHRVVAHADGSITLAGRYRSAGSATGIHVMRFRGSDGGVLWRRILPLASVAGEQYVDLLAFADGDVAIRTPGELWRVDGGSGVVEWTSAEPFVVNAMASVGADLAVAGYDGGRAVARLHGPNGTILWSRVLPVADPLHPGESLTAVSVDRDGRLLVSGGDGFFAQSAAALDALDGSFHWQVPVAALAMAGGESPAGSSHWPVGILQVQDGNVFFGGNLRPYPPTWTVVKVTGAFADGIFADGFQ